MCVCVCSAFLSFSLFLFIILYVNCFGRTMLYMCIEYHTEVNMYHVSTRGVDERMINVHYYYKESYFPYRNVKSISEPEQYLSAIEIYCFRVGLCQLRLGVLPINNNLHRYSACAIQRNCLFCVNAMRTKSTCCSLVPCIMTLGRNL